MSRRSDISLGDLLHAFRELEADEATKFAIAGLLKLTPFVSLEESREGGTTRLTGLDALAPGEDAREEAGWRAAGAGTAGQAEGDAQPDKIAEEIPPEQVSAPVIPSRLKKIGDDKGGVPPLRAGAPLLPKAAGQGGAEPHTFEPLLFPVWTRAILSGALSNRSNDGPLNIKKAVEKVAGGEASTRLPRYPRPTLARGVQVLVDRSETMLLFLEDQKWLEGEIQKVVGPGRAQILYFEGCPTRKAGRGSKSRWKRYMEHHLPSSGTVLLLLTDLGVGQPVSPVAPAGTQEWLTFAECLRRHGCPLVAFVPYAPERCPAALHRLMTILQWDRTTGASSIHARVGKGHVS